MFGRMLRFRYRTLTVHNKLILFALFMLIPVLLFSVIYLKQSQRILESRAGNLIAESLGLSLYWMDEMLDGAVRISVAVEADSMVRDFLLKHKETPVSQESSIKVRELQNRLTEILQSENRATSIWIYLPATNEVVSTKYGLYSLQDYEAFNWLKSLNESGNYRAWIYPDAKYGKYVGGLMDLGGNNGNTHVSFTRALPTTLSSPHPVIFGVGYLEFTLQDILMEVAQKTKTSLYLFDKNGQLVQQTEDRLPVDLSVADLYSSDRKSPKPSSDYTIVKGEWLIASAESKQTGWTLVSAAPLDYYMVDLKLLNQLTLVFTIIAIIFAIVTVRSLTRGIHAPISELLTAMKRMESGDLSVRLVYDRDDEFKRMANGFNRLVETQDTLIRTVYQERIAKQQAEMNFLTAQINPHFLYNTLGALYSLAKRVDDTLAKSILAMSLLFRLSLNKGREMVTVKDSIDLLTNYMHLLNIRHPDKYKLETYVEPSAESERIPTLMLQPIVENAVKHGLEMLPHPGTIRVTVTLLLSSLLIMISDNGIGIKPEALEKMRLAMKDNSNLDSDWRRAEEEQEERAEAGSGYALSNIYRRLWLKYGKQFVFQIDSELNKGTTVTIRIPREGVIEA